MPKIAIAGFHHETNTFSPHLTTLADFELADNWPGITTGDDFFEIFKDGNMPMAGFIKQARKYDFELYPLTWANAQPAGKVTKHAFESIVNKILDGLTFIIDNTTERRRCETMSKQSDKKDKLDAIYLDLHGSMVCEHTHDGEGELITQIRKLLESFEIDIPIILSHDLHANISDTTFELSDYIISYRTYPHVDMAKTGMAAAAALDMMLQLGGRLPAQPSASSQRQRWGGRLPAQPSASSQRQRWGGRLPAQPSASSQRQRWGSRCEERSDAAIPLPIAKKILRLNFLIPLTSQCTLTNPCKDIYQKLEDLENKYKVSLSFNPAFPLADSTYTGPTVIGYDFNTNNTDNLTTAITSLFEYINSNKDDFELKLFSEQEAIDYYLQKLPTQNNIPQEEIINPPSTKNNTPTQDTNQTPSTKNNTPTQDTNQTPSTKNNTSTQDTNQTPSTKNNTSTQEENQTPSTKNKTPTAVVARNEVTWQSPSSGNKPIIFADTQDNSGCGGVSNTTGILKILANNNIKNAAVAVMWDPIAAKLAHQNKIGNQITLSLGDGNFKNKFIIKNLANGDFTGTGDFYKNMKIKLGPMALLEHNNIYILVSSHKMQAADQAVFTHLGIKAQDFSLLVLKSSVHFRADFSDLASDIILVESQGENIADLNKLEYELCDLI